MTYESKRIEKTSSRETKQMHYSVTCYLFYPLPFLPLPSNCWDNHFLLTHLHICFKGLQPPDCIILLQSLLLRTEEVNISEAHKLLKNPSYQMEVARIYGPKCLERFRWLGFSASLRVTTVYTCIRAFQNRIKHLSSNNTWKLGPCSEQAWAEYFSNIILIVLPRLDTHQKTQVRIY